MVYLFVFIASLFLLSLRSEKRNKKINILLIAIGLLIPCVLAGLRSLETGTDIKVYVEVSFEIALKYKSFIDFFNAITIVQDILYLLVTFLCSRISNNISLLFFVFEALTIIPIYCALNNKYKANNNKIVFGMLIFYLFFYNQTLNMVRQSIAIAFGILAFSYLDQNKYKKFFLYTLIAFLFHKSAIILIPCWLLYIIFKTGKIKKNAKLYIKIGLLIVLIICIFLLPNILKILTNIGLFSKAKYNTYAIKYLNENLNFPIIYSFLEICTFIFIIFNKKRLTNDKNYEFWKYLCLLSIVISQFGATIKYAERISYSLFYTIVILYMPSMINNKKHMKIHRVRYIFSPITNTKKKIKKNYISYIFNHGYYIFNYVSYIMIFVIYWIYWVMIINYDSTYPFKLM